MAQETEADVAYRMEEQEFVQSLIGNLHRRTDEDHVKIFGYLLIGLTAILSGVERFDAFSTLPYGMPRSSFDHVEVGGLWIYVLQSAREFCTEGGKTMLNETHYKWVLKRIHKGMMASVYAPIVSARGMQNVHRI